MLFLLTRDNSEASFGESLLFFKCQDPYSSIGIILLTASSENNMVQIFPPQLSFSLMKKWNKIKII